MSKHDGADVPDNTNERERLLSEHWLGQQIAVAANQHEQLDEFIAGQRFRRKELLAALCVLIAILAVMTGAFIFNIVVGDWHDWIPGVAVLIAFGAYCAWSAYRDTSESLLRSQRLSRRLEAATTEAKNALAESTG